MFAQQVHAKVAVEIAPNAMDVVGVVLCVVVFDQEGRALQPVVMRIVAIDAACPCEINLLHPLNHLPPPTLLQPAKTLDTHVILKSGEGIFPALPPDQTKTVALQRFFATVLLAPNHLAVFDRRSATVLPIGL